jgi:NAD+ synthase
MKQVDAIRTVPRIRRGLRLQITASILTDNGSTSSLTIESPAGVQTSRLICIPAPGGRHQLPACAEDDRVHHADHLNYVVAGAEPPRIRPGLRRELGDGAADIKPSRTLQDAVYALADYVGVPDDIRRRPPTTDTFSMPEPGRFYFSPPPGRWTCACTTQSRNSASDVARPSARLRNRSSVKYRHRSKADRYLHTRPPAELAQRWEADRARLVGTIRRWSARQVPLRPRQASLSVGRPTHSLASVGRCEYLPLW